MSGPDREFVQQQLRALLAADNSVAGVLHEERWTSWGELSGVVAEIERCLADHAIPRRGRVALVVRNRPSGLAALLGLLAYGRVPALVSPIQPARAIAAAVERLLPVAVVLDRDDHGDELQAVAGHAGALAVVLPDGSVVRTPGPGALTADRLVPDEVALVVPTSGTTGTPKPISIGWEQLPFDRTRGLRSAKPPESRPPVIHALSMATITGVMGVLHAAAAGRSVALLERVDVVEWSRLVERFRLRRAGLPPAAMRTILDERIPADRFASLEAWQTGSAPLAPELQREFESTYGVPVLVAYGATEFGGAVASWTLDLHREWVDAKMGSVGRAVEGVELRVVDPDTGETMASGEAGVLCVRRCTPGRRDADVDGEGWLRTNDLARIDGDGFVYIDGRVDDVIVRGGFKVPLGELEALVRSHPDVRACAAVGLPDARLGSVPGLAVVLDSGAGTTTDALGVWIRERTAPYKVPRVIRQFEELPMGPSHKVDRAKLRHALEPSRPDIG